MNRSSDATVSRTPANRIGLHYRATVVRRCPGPIVDAHMHLKHAAHAPLFFEAAGHYGVARVLTMTPIEQAAPLRAAVGPDRLRFIAVPNWRRDDGSEDFRESWLRDLEGFRRFDARLCKFWMAPPMRERHGLTLQSEWLRPVISRAVELGYHFMVHVADPTVWWRPGAKYANTAKIGAKTDQYPALEWFLDHVAPRTVVGAHMGGNIEDPAFLQGLLDRHPNLVLDTSATKWIVREVARQPERVREFIVRNAERVLFGSDLVTDDPYDFDHYASRYWAHWQMWETAYRGESPIEDPDADDPPRLAGVDLPVDVLRRMYWENAERLGL
ncbi:MAG: amidohydrolase family protein [Phycisphaerae bacterium]